MHHKNPSRDGVYVQPALSKAAVATLHRDPAFNPTVVLGNVYAQPLFVDGNGGTDLVIVVTESNNVYALDGTSGAQVWFRNVGAPVPLAMLATCGDIDPIGITGTPVIDPVSRTLFFDAEVLPPGGAPTHRVFALSVDDGTIRTGWPVEIPTVVHSGSTAFLSNVQGQNGALTVLGGRVYVPYGGRFGDCGNYHGWVVGISVTDPTNVEVWATPAKGGSISTAGGLATDGTDLFASTGVTFGTNGTWGGGDAFLRFGTGPALGLSASFAPANWPALDNFGEDLGTSPVVFDLPGATPSALAIVFGFDGNAYLLDRHNPGGVGAALGANAAACSATSSTGCASLGVASNEIISAPVLYATANATYVAARANGRLCTGGTSGDLFTLKILPGAPPTLAASWCAVGGAGAPMVTTTDGHTDAIVWTLGAEADNRLHAFDGDTGAAIPFTGSTTALPGLRRLNTPIAAKGRIYVAVDGVNGGVVSFKP